MGCLSETSPVFMESHRWRHGEFVYLDSKIFRTTTSLRSITVTSSLRRLSLTGSISMLPVKTTIGCFCGVWTTSAMTFPSSSLLPRKVTSHGANSSFTFVSFLIIHSSWCVMTTQTLKWQQDNTFLLSGFKPVWIISKRISEEISRCDQMRRTNHWWTVSKRYSKKNSMTRSWTRSFFPSIETTNMILLLFLSSRRYHDTVRN